MKYTGTVISVSDIALSKEFYEELFNMTLHHDYGINKSFTCGLSLQQDFDWLVQIDKDNIQYKSNNMELCFEEEHFDEFLKKLNAYSNINYLGGVIEHSWGQRVIRFYDLDNHLIEVGESMKNVINRFKNSGMTMDEISKKMDVSIIDIEKILAEESS